MPYYLIHITDEIAVGGIIFVWVMILWNIKLATKVEKLNYKNTELQEKVSNLNVLLDFHEDLARQQQKDSSFTDGYN